MRITSAHDSSVVLLPKLLKADLRLFSLFLAIVLYACFGSPTPDSIGAMEGVVGGLLVFAIGVSGFAYVLKRDVRQSAWFAVGQLFLLYGLCVGLIGAMVSGAELSAVMRDVLPFGFMFLPLFLVSRYQDGRVRDALIFLFCLLGIVFALRASAPVLGLSFGLGYDALYYLGNSPAVLFAALFLWGIGIKSVAEALTPFHIVRALLFLSLSFLALIPIALTQQRAGIGAFALYAFLSVVYLFSFSPRRMIVVAGVFVPILMWLGAGAISGTYSVLETKTSLVGFNMRFEEWRAVWDAITVHPLSFLFGQGWGARFASPAVADIEVYFTHSLLSSMLLKLGLSGLILCCGYIGVLFCLLLKGMRSNLLLVMAISAPLLIDVFLYAAFKSLDFGLLLALIPLLVFSDDRHEQPIA